jgi:hypothetical protein
LACLLYRWARQQPILTNPTRASSPEGATLFCWLIQTLASFLRSKIENMKKIIPRGFR